MDEIEDYQPPRTEVTGVDEGRVEIFVDADIPDDGEAVALESEDGDRVYARVRSHLGGRRIEADLPAMPNWVAEGVAASTTRRRAGFRPTDGRLVVDADSLEPEPDEQTSEWFPADWTKPGFADIAADLPPVETGYESIDTVAPVARGGLNLVIDRSERPAPFHRLAERLHSELDEAETIWLLDGPSSEAPDWAETVIEPPTRAFGRMLGLRAAVALAAHRRDQGRETLVVAALPSVARTVTTDDEAPTTPGYEELVDRIGQGLTSSSEARITTLLRLPIPSRHADVAPIVETLGLGDVDAQLFVDDKSRFAPRRSSSDATLDEAHRDRQFDARDALRRADDARERAELLGERELTDAQLRALEREDELRERLVD
jgi:hypothetical protein